MTTSVLVLGATGTIGRACVAELVAEGYKVSVVTRKEIDQPVTVYRGDVTNAAWLKEVVFGAARFDAVICCLASRGGGPKDAWAIDHAATVGAIEAAKATGVGQFILLSAICVQKPKLAFQHAKLAAEEALVGSGLNYSIIRPTAFFKSLSGQIDRVKRGKPFLIFGDGTLTACKPISDRDLAAYIVSCIGKPERTNCILPIGGPGPAITLLDQAAHLARLAGHEVKTKSVPVKMFDVIAWVLQKLSILLPKLADKAEFARIGRYYATESMLVWDAARGTYDADATPETGSDTLFAYYDAVWAGQNSVERGEHSVF